MGALAFPLVVGCAPRDRDTFGDGGSGGTSGGSGGAANGGAANGGAAGTAGSGNGGSQTGGTGATGGDGGTGGAGATGGGGSGGTAGAGAATGGLGAVCKANGDCSTGLTCELNGYRDGVCTRACTVDADCSEAETVCLDGKCRERCAFGSGPKCEQRNDMICAPTTDGSGASATACVQICQVDADCAAGYCDPFGRCAAAPWSGPALGEACSVSQGACNCIGFNGPDPNVGFCSAFCRIGASEHSTCGQAPTGDLTAVCAFLTDASSGAGDLGLCGKTCRCDDECPRDTVCVDFGLPQAANGVCVPDDGNQQHIACQ